MKVSQTFRACVCVRKLGVGCQSENALGDQRAQSTGITIEGGVEEILCTGIVRQIDKV